MVTTGEHPPEVVDRVREVWEAHHERVWRAVLVWSGDEQVAQDAVAEAFAQVLRRGEAVVDVAAWVWRTSFRIAGGLLVERGRHEQLPDTRLQDTRLQNTVISRGDPLPEDVIALGECLGKLNERDRTVVVLSLVAGWSSGEIAEQIGSSPGAVRVRLHRARSSLRTCLEGHYG